MAETEEHTSEDNGENVEYTDYYPWDEHGAFNTKAYYYALSPV